VAGFGGLPGLGFPPDLLVFRDIAFRPGTKVGFTEAASNLSGTLSVTDGVQTANITLLGQYTAAQFTAASDATAAL
jgi:hypothetical protein